MGLKHRFKQQLKPIYFGGKRLLARKLFSYTPLDFAAALQDIGVARGDALLLHSGFSRYSGFAGNASDVIDTLLDVLGDEGQLLMMSMPYGGSSERYVATNPVFDVARTPSAVGLISEAFRRRAGVVRSLSPLHPVLAHGPLAAWITADHDQSGYSCGKGSPFERFLSLDGKFLFFDAPYASLTFMHYVEDRYQERLPVPLYDPAAVSLTVKDARGGERQVRQFFFSQAARDRRHFNPIEQALRQGGAMRAAKIGNSRMLCVAAADVVSTAEALLDQGTGFYR